MAVTQAQIDAFKTHCVKKPNHILNTDELQKQWTPGFFEHTVKENENLQSIAKYYLNNKMAPYGFDWKWLCRFNFGVDYPPYVNYKLIDEFGIDVSSEAEMNKNRTKDHKNYSFKGDGNEKLKIPFLAGASKPGSICPNRQNVIQRRAIKITSAHGPTFMTADIASNFSVTGYSVDKKDVTQQKMNSVRWWITNITKKDIGETDDRGSIHELSKLKGEDSGKTGEKVKLTITQANVTSGKYRIGDWIRMYPYFDDKANIDLLVYVQFRLIAVEFKHDIPRTEIDGGLIAANDPINKIHNPAVVLIGAETEQTCAKFRLTKVTSDVKKDDAGHDVIVDGKKVMIPAISVNDEGFIWKIKSIPGKATFVKIKMKPENTGSDCLVYGTEPGYIRLEGWCLEAEKYCVSKILKVVNEREIPFRVNLCTSKGGHTTQETIANLQNILKVQDIYMRPAGVKLVPDSSTAAGEKINDAEDEVIAQATIVKDGSNVNVPGFFNITNIDDKYVNILAGANFLITPRINGRPGVINYVLIRKILRDSILGAGIGQLRNLHTKPYQLRLDGLNDIKDYFIGPDEETVWLDANKKFEDNNIDDTTDKKSLKKMKAFETPKNGEAHKNLCGILLPKSSTLQETIDGGMSAAKSLTLVGATYAHEVGHLLAIRHRGGNPKPPPENEGAEPDLLPSSVTNIMYWTEDAGNNPADWDLIQAEVLRGSVLCAKDSNKGNITVKAFTTGVNRVLGKKNTEKTFRVEVRRKDQLLVGAFMNLFVEETREAIQIKQVDNWDKGTRKLSTGSTEIKIKFSNAASVNDTAKLVIMVGDNDDLATLEITCKVTA